MTDGGDKLDGVLIIRAGLDNFTENRDEDFAGDSEDRWVLAVSESDSGGLLRRPRSDLAVRDEYL